MQQILSNATQNWSAFVMMKWKILDFKFPETGHGTQFHSLEQSKANDFNIISMHHTHCQSDSVL